MRRYNLGYQLAEIPRWYSSLQANRENSTNLDYILQQLSDAQEKLRHTEIQKQDLELRLDRTHKEAERIINFLSNALAESQHLLQKLAVQLEQKKLEKGDTDPSQQVPPSAPKSQGPNSAQDTNTFAKTLDPSPSPVNISLQPSVPPSPSLSSEPPPHTSHSELLTTSSPLPPPPPPPPLPPPPPPVAKISSNGRFNKLHWKIIRKDNTIFSGLDYKRVVLDKVTLRHFLSSSASKKSGSRLRKGLEKKQPSVSLLSTNRSNNLSVMLKSFSPKDTWVNPPKHQNTFSYIIDALNNLDEEVLSEDKLEQVIESIQLIKKKETASNTNDERMKEREVVLQGVEEHLKKDGNLNKIPEPERFLYATYKIPHLLERLVALRFKLTFRERIDVQKLNVETYSRAINSLSNPKALKILLEIVLAILNTFNQSNAQAFPLTYLCKLSEYKKNETYRSPRDEENTLLYFVLKLYKLNFETNLNFDPENIGSLHQLLEDLSPSKEASSLMIEDISFGPLNLFNEVKGILELAKAQKLSDDDPFCKVIGLFPHFFDESQGLVQKVEDVLERWQTVQTFLGNEEKLSISEFFASLGKFYDDVQKVVDNLLKPPPSKRSISPNICPPSPRLTDSARRRRSKSATRLREGRIKGHPTVAFLAP